MNSFKLSLLLILFAGKFSQAQSITACPADSIRTWLSTYHVPAVAIGILEDNKIKSVSYYGESMPGTPATDQTIWNVASLTKPVTAATVMSLINTGKWNLDAPVSPYYVEPDVKDEPWTKELTTRIFLSHQSGFKNWKWAEPDRKMRFHYEPGKGYGYSGFGYEYLRQAVEKKMNKNLQQLANEELFARAGMEHTYYGWNDGLDSNRFAWAYNDKGVRYNRKYKGVNAADWLITTMTDYCKFGLYVMSGEGISKKLFNEVTHIQVHMDSLAAHKDNGMGLGWEVISNLPHGEYALTHNGSDDGVATLVLLFPNSKRGIVIFTNGDKGAKVIAKILKNSKIDLQPELAKSMGEFN